MPRVATKLAPAAKGGFVARKVIPFDVRSEYAKLYGRRTEERLNTGLINFQLARAKHRLWASEIEARIANIRATRNGEGRSLTVHALYLARRMTIWTGLPSGSATQAARRSARKSCG